MFSNRRSFIQLLAAGSLLSACNDGDGADGTGGTAGGAGGGGGEGTGGQTGAAGDQLIFLGTQGGPTFAIGRGESAAVLLIGGVPYMMDCGYGALRGLVQAGVNYLEIGQIFLSHLHDDHCSDVAALLSHQWTRSRKDPTVVHGPYGTDDLVDAAIAFSAANVRIRTADEGRTLSPEALFSGIALDASETPTVIYQDDLVTVSCIENTHFPDETKELVPDRSLAYRFDSAERSIVFSGDTTYTERVVALAKDADILVCEAIDVIATRANFDQQVAMGAFGDNPEGIWNHIVGTHTPCEDAGRMATDAGVQTLVLNHLVPGGLDPNQTDQDYIDQVTSTFSGEVIVSADQMIL
jgi:ribonuclease BN (tRNA processing enzyme)